MSRAPDQRLKVRLDHVDEKHTDLTIFQSADSENWGNCGRITVDTEWVKINPALAGMFKGDTRMILLRETDR